MAQQQQAQQTQQQPLPSEVYLLAVQNHLGTLSAEYKAKLAFFSARVIAILTLVGILGGVGLLAYGGYFLEQRGMLMTWAFPGLILLCAGVWLAINALRYHGLRVYVFTEGLVHVKGNKTNVIRWDQVKTMWQKVNKRFISSFYIGTVHLYTVQREDGKKFTFDDGLSNVETLGNTIVLAVNNSLLPVVIDTYTAGNPVVFGKLSVSIHGISNGEEIFLWNQIRGIQVNKGTLMINKDGQLLNWPSIVVSKTPNFPVFMALVDYVIKSQ